MTENPYQPPTAEEPLAGASAAARLPRPLGVILVASLLLLFSIGGLAMLMPYAIQLGVTSSLVLYDMVYAVPPLIAGIALIRGKTWGWGLATFLMTVRLLIHGSNIVALFGMTGIDWMIPFSAHLTSIAIFGSLLFYLYRLHVVEYFRLPGDKRLVMLGGEVVLAILFILCMPLLMRGFFVQTTS